MLHPLQPVLKPTLLWMIAGAPTGDQRGGGGSDRENYLSFWFTWRFPDEIFNEELRILLEALSAFNEILSSLGGCV